MSTQPGSFRVVGVGPGDPELITLKAARLIESAAVVAYHQGVGKSSNARRIASGLFPDGVVEEVLQYPVTTGVVDHPGGYDGAMSDFYDDCERRVGAHLADGRDVVLLAEGDPLFYGSAMYLHDRLSTRFDTAVVPGVPAFVAATATAGVPLVRHTDVLTVLPGTLPVPELARRLADTDAAIIMKLGRTFPGVRDALEQAGRLEGALYVERASMTEERYLPVAEVPRSGTSPSPRSTPRRCRTSRSSWSPATPSPRPSPPARWSRCEEPWRRAARPRAKPPRLPPHPPSSS